MRELKRLARNDRERFVVPRSVQCWIPIDEIYPDGIFRSGSKFSKCFAFSDINYAIASKDDQTAMFLLYCELINALDASATAKITLNNRRVNRSDFEESVLIPERDDSLSEYRNEYNRVLLDRAMTAGNNLTQDKTLTISVAKRNIEEARSYFSRVSAEMQTRFAQLSSNLSALNADQRLKMLHDFFRPNEDLPYRFSVRLAKKRGHSPIDYICPDSVEMKADYFKLDNRFGRVLYIRDYANYVKDSLIQELCDLNRALVLSIDMIPIPTDEAVKVTNTQLLKVETNISNFNRKQASNPASIGVVPYEMQLQQKEAKEFLEDLTTRDQRMMLVSVTLVHMAGSKEELDSDTEALMAVGRKHLCQVATLRYQQSDGLHTALPYGVRRTDTLRTMTTESTAILMPFNTQEMFASGGVCYGRNIISKNLISIDRKRLLNGNGFFLGVSGSGKSFLSKEEIVANATGTDDDIIIIDPEREYTMIVQAMGGEVIRISATSRHHINAMDISRDYGDEENPVLLKSEFLLSLCEMAVGSGGLTAREKSLIDRCIASVYQGYISRNYTGNPPTLAHFHQELLKQPEQEAREIALALELFTQGSLNTFARHTNVDTENRILCFDIHDLGSQLKPIGMLVVLDAIYNRIARNRAMKKNTWIYVDEIYLMFRSEYSSNFLFELWKRVRKYGAFCTGISQNIEDMLQSHVARAMLGNSEFLVLLNQSASDRAELSRLLNISGTQLNYITNAEAGTGLIKCGGSIIPFESKFPTDTRLYSMMTTKLDEQL